VLERDPEYLALKKLAERNRKHPPKTPLDALQHIVDIAREMTDGTFGALASPARRTTSKGFVVSGMDEKALSPSKARRRATARSGLCGRTGCRCGWRMSPSTRRRSLPAEAPRDEGAPRPADLSRGPTVRGALYVTDRKSGSGFRPKDEQALTVLAHHAGLIIEASGTDGAAGDRDAIDMAPHRRNARAAIGAYNTALIGPILGQR